MTSALKVLLMRWSPAIIPSGIWHWPSDEMRIIIYANIFKIFTWLFLLSFFFVQGLKYFFFQSKGSGDNQCPHPTNKLDKAVRPTQECLNRQNWWKNYTCKLYCPDGKRPAVSGMHLIQDYIYPTLPQSTLYPRKVELFNRTLENWESVL